MQPFIAVLVLLLAAFSPAAAETVTKTYALSVLGPPQYAEGFDHLAHANPDAPKGGVFRRGVFGGFDSLNGFISKGNPAAAIALTHDSLMESHPGELSTQYGLIAESVEFPDDFSWVIFNLRATARFHDGTPITADDVAFSFQILKDKGQPFYRYYYKNVAWAEILGPRRIKFNFDQAGNRELPLIMGQLVVLSKAYWAGRDFGATTLTPPLGSGPYRAVEVEANRRVVLARVKDYWGANLGINRGRYNFDRIVYEYFPDRAANLEAFKGYIADFRNEASSKTWATAYQFPAQERGDVITQLVPHSRPTGMQGFVYNIRRQVFKNRALRQALSFAFDFEWANRELFYGQYTRSKSYFSNSELASTGLPSLDEMLLLTPLRGQIPEQVFTTAYAPPTTKGGSLRENLNMAFKLLDAAGYKIDNGALIDPKNGRQVAFEILLSDPQFERIVLPFVRNLKRIGVAATVRNVDTAQYQNRVSNFDYDMIISTFRQSESPGNEQRDFFGSSAADRKGSMNLIGIRSRAIDTLIKSVIFAPDRAALITATRALDRVLLHSHYVIPQWHISASRIAYWNKFGRPPVDPKYGVDVYAWWIDAGKAAQLDARYK